MLKKHHSGGFTLVEMILVIVIVGIILSIGAIFLTTGLKGNFATEDSVYTSYNARTALLRMGDDLKEARAATASDLSPSANSITFTTISGNTITYSLSGTNLMRNSQILASHTSALSFVYLTATNTTTSNPTLVRCIVVSTTTQYHNFTLPLQTVICPRNYVL
jgi:prepilin-type N-terminal cleavage/methylation domain-containing protein